MASTKKPVTEQPIDVQAEIDALVAKANKALAAFMDYTQDRVDEIVKAMALAGIDNHQYLAHLAHDETGKGVYEDKMIKNLFATEYIYNSIKKVKTVGVVEDNELEEFYEVAEPIGVIAGVTPVTNPTSTTMFKILISIKARNPIIFGFHPSAQKSSAEAARILYEAALEAGAPEGCIQWIDHPSMEATNLLMNHPGVALVLATGGSGMVKAAYSTGKPAYGVGPGNVPCYVDKTADLEQSATDLILSKTFDNGMICASEQAVIVDKEVAADFERILRDNNCYFLSKEEMELVAKTAIDEERSMMSPAIVGQPAAVIAGMAGVKVPADTKILVAKETGVGIDHPLTREKLSPILAFLVANSTEEGISLAEQMVEFNGMGHSAVIHSRDELTIQTFSDRLKAGRIIVNAPSSQGAIGDIYNANTPSLTLGCGSYGKNSTSQNVSVMHLVNRKRVAKRRVNMQWFKVPPKIFFQWDSVQYLRDMPEISRAFIVTDELMSKLGYVDKVLYYLRHRTKSYVHCEVFADVEPDPDIETVRRGYEAMTRFQPDVIIALGGGSAMDAAKCMWLYYEQPDTDFNNLRMKFMDIRKRTFQFPKLGNKAKMVAIPTTSGTGSEVTAFAVISDKAKNMKYPLADYELTPDVAIIDPQFVMSVPPSVTASTGLDVLTHAIEAYVSVMASDYTDALAIGAIKMVFDYLPRAYADPNDRVAREKMHNASCMAGMAFTNAMLGINHSLAHKLGGEFHIPHGRANAILLPLVIEYNAKKPTKFTAWPKYDKFIADERYAEIARTLNLKADTTEQGVKSLIEAVKKLVKQVNEKTIVAACGIDEKTYMAAIRDLADKALDDQCTGANPKYPLLSELEEIYRRAYK